MDTCYLGMATDKLILIYLVTILVVNIANQTEACSVIATCYFCTISYSSYSGNSAPATSAEECKTIMASSPYESATYYESDNTCYMKSTTTELSYSTYSSSPTSAIVTFRKTCNTECTIFSVTRDSSTVISEDSGGVDYSLDRSACLAMCADTAGCLMLHAGWDGGYACTLYTTCGTNCSTEGGYQFDRTYTRWCHTASDCELAPRTPNGTILYNDGSTRNGSAVSYRCRMGWDPANSNTRTCVNGDWTTENFTCKVADCGDIPVQANATAVYNSTLYNSVVEYTCDTGLVAYRASYSSWWYPIGSNTFTIQCMDGSTSNAFWSSSPAYKCKLADCGSPTDPSDGTAHAPFTTYGGQVTFSCHNGYDLSSNDTLTCGADQVWQGTPPTCIIKDCGSITAPGNGSIHVSSETFGGVATYFCDTGYNLNGAVTRTCDSSGTWTGSDSLCSLKDCGTLAPPINGNVSAPSTTYLSTAIYSCDFGYDLTGDTTRTCDASGAWDGTEPSCTIIDCGGLDPLDDGNVDVTTTTYGSQATHSCDTGYELSGNETRTCELSGQWSGSEPACSILDCGPLTSPANGNVPTSSTTYNQQVTYVCDNGYTLVGVSIRTCNASGLWSDYEPSCVMKDCGSLLAPANGNVSAPSTTYLSTAIYSCDFGYDLTGDTTRTCDASGAWDGTEPSCTIIDCGGLDPLDNGNVDGTTTTFGSQATHSCDTGYELSGNETRTCELTGQWSGSEPACFELDCGPLTAPANGSVSVPNTKYNQQAIYECDSGYNLTGTAVRNCNASGLWDGSTPTCDLLDCGSLPAIANGYINITSTWYTGVANYSCDVGYNLSGNETRTCELSGQWSGSQPSCSLVDCGSLVPPYNGSVAAPGTTYGHQANYSCDIGYRLDGVSFRTCNASGLWSDNAPTCVIEDCGPLSPPSNGSVSTPSTAYLSTATYFCDTGYNITGSAMRACNASGFWDGSEPTCDLITCGSLSPIVNGNVNVTSTTWNSQANYSCELGFKSSGNETRTCELSGLWSGSEPLCSLLDCGPLLDPMNGTVVVPNTTYNQQATYYCDPGFYVDGVSVRTCNLSELWTDTVPTCQIIDCGILLDISDGFVTFTGTTENSTAAYACFTGFDLSKDTNRTCNSSGLWAGAAPECVPKDCGMPVSPGNGNVSAPLTTFMQQAVFSCNTGYTLNGHSMAQCQADGTWNASAPICTVTDCGALPPPTNGAVSTGGGTTYSKVVVFTCSTGFTRLGAPTRTCQGNGAWSGSAPTCVSTAAVPVTERIFIAPCVCYKNKTFTNLTQEQIIEQLIADTAINLKNTTSARSKLECRDDPRTSSLAIGMLGAGLMALVAAFALMVDSIRVWKFVSERRSKYREDD